VFHGTKELFCPSRRSSISGADRPLLSAGGGRTFEWCRARFRKSTTKQSTAAHLRAVLAGSAIARDFTGGLCCRGAPPAALTGVWEYSSFQTRATDRRAHRPLLGQLNANEVTRADIETFKSGVVSGKLARDQKLGPRRRSIVRGGKGALTRTLGLLGAIFAWGQDNGYVANNPVRGAKRFADAQKKALLTAEQYRTLALTLETLDAKRDRKGDGCIAPSGCLQSDSSH
jgi:hypothetical protein